MECDTFSFSALTLLLGDEKGIRCSLFFLVLNIILVLVLVIVLAAFSFYF